MIFLDSQIKDYNFTNCKRRGKWRVRGANYIPLQGGCQPKSKINPQNTGRNFLIIRKKKELNFQYFIYYNQLVGIKEAHRRAGSFYDSRASINSSVLHFKTSSSYG